MIRLKEKDIEDIIYDSPWLLNDMYIIPRIIGSQNQMGRQINIGRQNSRFIDLLFKDSIDSRPVIVELKQAKLNREHIGQILEYRALLISIDEDKKEEWISEFGQNYYAPKLVLIGSDIDEGIRISANLAGIEVRTFQSDFKEIGIGSVADLKQKLKEWNDFRSHGNRPFEDRQLWIEGIIDSVNEVALKYDNITTTSGLARISKNYYQNDVSLFIDIPVFIDDSPLLGLYEYADDQLPFDDEFIYCDYWFLFNDVIETDNKKDILSNFQQFLFSNDLAFASYITDDEYIPVIKIKREILEHKADFKSLIEKMIDNAIELLMLKK